MWRILIRALRQIHLCKLYYISIVTTAVMKSPMYNLHIGTAPKWHHVTIWLCCSGRAHITVHASIIQHSLWSIGCHCKSCALWFFLCSACDWGTTPMGQQRYTCSHSSSELQVCRMPTPVSSGSGLMLVLLPVVHENHKIIHVNASNHKFKHYTMHNVWMNQRQTIFISTMPKEASSKNVFECE